MKQRYSSDVLGRVSGGFCIFWNDEHRNSACNCSTPCTHTKSSTNLTDSNGNWLPDMKIIESSMYIVDEYAASCYDHKFFLGFNIYYEWGLSKDYMR